MKMKNEKKKMQMFSQKSSKRKWNNKCKVNTQRFRLRFRCERQKKKENVCHCRFLFHSLSFHLNFQITSRSYVLHRKFIGLMKWIISADINVRQTNGRLLLWTVNELHMICVSGFPLENGGCGIRYGRWKLRIVDLPRYGWRDDPSVLSPWNFTSDTILSLQVTRSTGRIVISKTVRWAPRTCCISRQSITNPILQMPINRQCSIVKPLHFHWNR